MPRNPYVKIYVNNELLRKFGGKRSAVRETKLEYARMTKQQLFEKHPYLMEVLPKGPVMIKTEYYSANQQQAWHAKNIIKHRA